MIKLLAKPVTEALQSDIKKRTALFQKKYHRSPKLVVVLAGDDPASLIYTRRKGEVAVALGMAHETYHLPQTASPNEVQDLIQRLNQDPSVDGILIQRPLPKAFKEVEVLYWVHPEKDVDAFHPENAGRLFLGLPAFQPCTPSGVMELLKFYGIQTEGKIACIIGRSSIVGKPMAALLLQANSTVLHCHSKTPDLTRFTQQADILIVAAGKRGLIDHRHVKDQAVVIDVGMHRTEDGKVVGDVNYESVVPKVSAITPVPGGVGPMTITILMQNTIDAAERRAKQRG